MGTRANVFVDILAKCSSVSALKTAMVEADWHTDRGEVAGGNWALKTADMSDSTMIVMRMTPADWTALQGISSAMATLTVMQTADPYAPLSFADPTNPTEDELNANDVFYKASKVNRDVAEIRKTYASKVDIVDDTLAKVAEAERGIRFASFGDYTKDIAGTNEVVVPGTRRTI